jgi:formylglycine-generating enzyme required for sulfatase activity
MSPEQLSGDGARVGPWSDVYALGVIAYQAVTGTLPYALDGSIAGLVRGISEVEPVPPSRVAPRRVCETSPPDPDHVDAVILQALAKVPDRRYASAGPLADDLERCLAGLAPRAADASRPGPQSWTRRRFVLTAAAALCAASSGAVWWGARGGPPSPSVEALPEMTNGVGIRLVRIGPRTVYLGSPPTEPGRGQDERPYEVTLARPFYIGTTEVTQAQYRALMGTNPSHPDFLGDALPVQCVSWDEAVAFCQRLGEVERQSYRLPTEAEWECACRAGTRGSYGGTQRLGEIAWYRDNSGGRLHPVGGKLPNRWGLFDMHGGVAEWCGDAYTQWRTARSGGGDGEGDALTADQKLVRGGDFLAPAEECRSARRDCRDRRHRSRTIGFRVVLAPTSVL